MTEHEKKITPILEEILSMMEDKARKGKEHCAGIHGTALVVATSLNKISVSWGEEEKFKFLEEYLKEKGFVPGKHDHKMDVVTGTHPIRQFKKELE